MNALSRIVLARNVNSKVLNVLKYSTSGIAGDRWKGVVNNAEKVVGYPTSFLNLRWLLNDEISNIALHITKLIGTNHPIIKIARDLLHQTDCPKWGLIILLVSKAAGINHKVAEIERDITSGILHNQRVLAEITEMIKTGHNLHNGMMKIDDEDDNHNDLRFGNKIALLSGDYLYSKSFQELAQLKNHSLNEIISTSLRDLAEAEFFRPRDSRRDILPHRPCIDKNLILSKTDPGPYDLNKYMGNSREEWILRNLLNGVNLLAKSCKGALILGEHPEFLQDKAYIFGRSLALAWQANEETKPFLHKSFLPFTLVNAPVIFQLESDPDMYDLLDASEIDYETIRSRVIEGEGVEKTMNLQMEFVDDALEALEYFPESDARDSLVKIVRALEI
ncbi:hypothetical protein HHI36_005771 [Cryptolaemus montrouzieri]|uniref:Uncharacterized protein n=1 Tax=Cryptolaemus montrouzieri TaxID=559131 RepID=A0ABD2NW47_9CUCU